MHRLVELGAAEVTFHDNDPEVAAARGMHYEHLDQLALEHLMGAR